MRARLPAIVAAIALLAVACQAAAPSASAPPASATPAPTAAPTPVPTTAARPSVLRVSRISDFLPSIHPVNLGTGNQELMADIVFSTLVDVDSDEVTILPDLATEWTASPDATVYTFKLNPAAVWSDGKPVTADDVEWTIAWAAQNPSAWKNGIPTNMWFNVKGGVESIGTTTIPEGIKKIDANTVEITLAAPDATFLRRIAGAVYYIQPKHILDGLTAAEAETCEFCLGTAGVTIGSGPYDFETSISAGGANFKAKKGYWKGKDGPFEQIVYKIQESNVSVAQLAAGELDLTIRVPPAEGPGLASVPGLKQLNVPGVGIFNINFHNQNTDKALRQAAAYAINRPQIIETVLGGLATLNYTIPPGIQGLRRHQQVRVQPRHGEGQAGRIELGHHQDLPARAPCRGPELHDHSPRAPAVARGHRDEGGAHRPADRPVHGPDPEDRRLRGIPELRWQRGRWLVPVLDLLRLRWPRQSPAQVGR